MTSAAFTVNATAVPRNSGAAIDTTYGGTVSLALASTVGVETVTWYIAGVSGPSVASPTISRSGTPLGATATFTVGADPGDGAGIAYGIRCDVRDGNGTLYQSYGVVGVPNVAGGVPLVAGEDGAWRHATLGWTPVFNTALLGFPNYAASSTTTGTSTQTATTVAIPAGKLARIDCVWSAYDAVADERLYRQAGALFSCDSAGTAASAFGAEVDVFNQADDLTWNAGFAVSGSGVAINYSGDATNSVAWNVMVWRTLQGV